HSGFADKHVVGFFGKHEAAGARERIECGLPQRRKLELAIAIVEEGRHEAGEPMPRLLVEGGEDARVVGVAGAALDQVFSRFTSIFSKVAVEKVDHGPKMTSLFDV